MSDLAAAIDQQEATVAAVEYAYSALNQETRRDIQDGWYRIRTAAGLTTTQVEPDSVPVVEAIEAVNGTTDTPNDKSKNKK